MTILLSLWYDPAILGSLRACVALMSCLLVANGGCLSAQVEPTWKGMVHNLWWVSLLQSLVRRGGWM